MEKSSKRGKIPQQDWPSIITRYEAGETLASIARTYDCSPPAISYIVSRTRARSAAAEAAGQNPPPAAEPQLVKGSAPETPADSIAASEVVHGAAKGGEIPALGMPPREPRLIEQPVGAERRSERQLFPEEPRSSPPAPSNPPAHPPASRPMHERELSSDPSVPARNPGQRQVDPGSGNGDIGHSSGHSGAPGHAPGLPENGESRRKLHLSLHGNGGAHASEPSQGAPGAPSLNFGSGSGSRVAQRSPDWQQGAGLGRPGSDSPPPSAFQAPSSSQTGAGTGNAAAQHRDKEAGAFIGQALRERVEGDITAFLAAFDAALADDSPESRTGLREATDRLLRAGARTRIELERLEARAPLPSRDKNGQPPHLFRR